MDKDDNVVDFSIIQGGSADDEDVHIDKEEDVPTSEEILERSKENDFHKVIVLGLTEEDSLGMLSNMTDESEINYIVDKLKLWLLGVV